MGNLESLGLTPQTQKEPLQKEKKLDNVKLLAEEAALTSEQKIEKIYSFRKKSISLAAAILKETDDSNNAEDVVSEAYVKAVKYIDKFRHESALETWFYRIVVNAALMFLRGQKSRIKEKTIQMPVYSDHDTGELMDIEIPDSRPNPEEIVTAELTTEEERKLLNSTLAKLPPAYRMAIMLTGVDGMQDKDVAEISGIKTETHKSRKRRALIELRKILKVKIKTKNMDNKPYRK